MNGTLYCDLQNHHQPQMKYEKTNKCKTNTKRIKNANQLILASAYCAY